jgi:hypothetical protein
MVLREHSEHRKSFDEVFVENNCGADRNYGLQSQIRFLRSECPAALRNKRREQAA